MERDRHSPVKSNTGPVKEPGDIYEDSKGNCYMITKTGNHVRVDSDSVKHVRKKRLPRMVGKYHNYEWKEKKQ